MSQIDRSIIYSSEPSVTKFWMVIKGSGPGSATCQCRHESLAEAEEEAMRLCKKTGDVFYVLETVEVIEACSPPVQIRRLP